MSISQEYRDIGKFPGRKTVYAPEKTNFSQTCNLLSQYLKEKRSFGDLSFGAASPSGSISGKSSSSAMDLFPQHTGFGSSISGKEDVTKNLSDLSEIKPKAKQMTIMYAGKVVVFDDISEEKVKELMTLANNNGSSEKVDLNSVNNSVEERIQVPIQAPASVLPLARKASLHRFLEKRKDRIAARAPYQIHNSSATTTITTKEEESKSWLGLASPCSSGLGQ